MALVCKQITFGNSLSRLVQYASYNRLGPPILPLRCNPRGLRRRARCGEPETSETFFNAPGVVNQKYVKHFWMCPVAATPLFVNNRFRFC